MPMTKSTVLWIYLLFTVEILSIWYTGLVVPSVLLWFSAVSVMDVMLYVSHM
jgi:hypothetical protein